MKKGWNENPGNLRTYQRLPNRNHTHMSGNYRSPMSSNIRKEQRSPMSSTLFADEICSKHCDDKFYTSPKAIAKVIGGSRSASKRKSNWDTLNDASDFKRSRDSNPKERKRETGRFNTLDNAIKFKDKEWNKGQRIRMRSESKGNENDAMSSQRQQDNRGRIGTRLSFSSSEGEINQSSSPIEAKVDRLDLTREKTIRNDQPTRVNNVKSVVQETDDEDDFESDIKKTCSANDKENVVIKQSSFSKTRVASGSPSSNVLSEHTNTLRNNNVMASPKLKISPKNGNAPKEMWSMTQSRSALSNVTLQSKSVTSAKMSSEKALILEPKLASKNEFYGKTPPSKTTNNGHSHFYGDTPSPKTVKKSPDHIQFFGDTPSPKTLKKSPDESKRRSLLHDVPEAAYITRKPQDSIVSVTPLTPEKPKLPLGLPNTGHTCYLNAVLQSLFALPPFMAQLKFRREQLGNEDGSVMQSLLHVAKIREEGDEERLLEALKAFKMDFVKVETQFEGFHMQDAHEFLLLLFEALEKSQGDHQQQVAAVDEPFKYHVVESRICKECYHTTVKTTRDVIFRIALNTNPSIVFQLHTPRLSTAIGNSLKSTLRCHCENCPRDQEGKAPTTTHDVRSYFRSLPLILALVFPRTYYTNTEEGFVTRKSKRHLEIPLELDLKNNVEQKGKADTSESIFYELRAVVLHLGSSSTSGHYVADVLCPESKEWHRFDDRHVSKPSETKVLKQAQENGYLFLYVKKQQSCKQV